MICKYRIGKDKEGSGHILIQGTLIACTRLTEENHPVLVTTATFQLEISNRILQATKKKIGIGVNTLIAIFCSEDFL